MQLAEIVQAFSAAHRLSVTSHTDAGFIIDSPVPGRRNQQVLAETITNELYNRQMVRISSVVCPTTPDTNLEMLLEQSAYFNYCRFTIRSGRILVESVTRADAATVELITEIIMEVANLADQYELKLTGKDRH